ncbi:hypothetical protein ACP70R_004921 [Stipagrostis hirtigluma subsp. patula]
MGEAAERTGTSSATDDTPAHLPDDIVAEILVLLPTRSVIRSGAVCKAWRRITADPGFRARRLPASILVYTYLDLALLAVSRGLPRRRPDGIDFALDAVPISSDDGGRRRLICYSRGSPADPGGPSRLLASCDGILLFTKDELYLLCNPATRQWAQLPRLPDEYYKGHNREYAFYFHRPSGPPRRHMSIKLCEMGGLLVAADCNLQDDYVNFWFLEDYNARRWEHRHQVASPWSNVNNRLCKCWHMVSMAAAGDSEDNFIFIGAYDMLLVYDMRTGQTIRIIDLTSSEHPMTVVSSIAGMPHPYNVSKAVVIGLVRSVAGELAGHGVRVNAISPAGIATPFAMAATAKMFPGMGEEERRRLIEEDQSELRGAKLEAENIARTAVYLASDEAKYVSGNLVVDRSYSVTKRPNMFPC